MSGLGQTTILGSEIGQCDVISILTFEKVSDLDDFPDQGRGSPLHLLPDIHAQPATQVRDLLCVGSCSDRRSACR